MNRDTICVQQHNNPLYGDQTLTEHMKKQRTVAQSSIEMLTQDEYKTFDKVVSSIALSSQAMDSFAANCPPQNSNTCNSINGRATFKMERDVVKNLPKETYTVVLSSANAKDKNAAIDLSQTSYVSDITEGSCTPGHEVKNAKDITSHYNRQNYEGSDTCISTSKDEEYCKSNSLTRPDSSIMIQPLRDLGNDHYNNVNYAMNTNSKPSYSRNLPGSSSTLTEADNNTKAKTLSGHTFEIEHKRVVFTELNLKSASQKNVRSSDRWIPSITGCVFMPDDRVVLCDQHINSGTLIQLDQSFSLQNILDLPSRPNDVSVVDDTTVIITLRSEKQLQYVEVAASLKLGRVLQLDNVCWCVHVVGNSIYVICRYPGGYGEVRILDKDGNLRNRLGVDGDKTFMLKRPYNITVSARSGNVYVSDWCQDKVTCLQSDGTVIFEYKDPESKSPLGLCVDDEDNVIVCGGRSDNIHIVTAAGKKSAVILSANDGIITPRSVTYRRTDHT